MTEETETDRKTAESTDEMIMKNRKAAAESDTKTEERDRQTVTVTAAEAVIVTAAKTDVEMKRAMNSESRKNIRLLTIIQMMLRVLFIS